MTLLDVNEMFSSDEKCRELLKRLRWPHGVKCPRCKGNAVPLATAKQLFYCDDCAYQFSVTAGTIFNDSHLPLEKWFIATYLICESRKGHSANQMKRELGVSYKTAWYLCHRIRAAMKETERPMLDGTVEMDETYVGGRKRNIGSRGPYGSDKEIVIGIRRRNGELRFFHASDATSATLGKYIRENISEDVDVIVTDEHPAYPTAMGSFRPRHKTIKHADKIYVQGEVHTNTI
ncbi:MAG: IS1595 family transposase [Acidobacteriia bacterium]|nr:IS1595 family transposase [Terriglobia bacterium]